MNMEFPVLLEDSCVDVPVDVDNLLGMIPDSPKALCHQYRKSEFSMSVSWMKTIWNSNGGYSQFQICLIAHEQCTTMIVSIEN
jgi:hypothetical protein